MARRVARTPRSRHPWRKMMFRAPRAAAAALLLATAATAAPAYPTAIRHVFVIVLENEDFATIFGDNTPSPYLGHDLPSQGALFTNYYATGHASLGNYTAMISA